MPLWLEESLEYISAGQYNQVYGQIESWDSNDGLNEMEIFVLEKLVQSIDSELEDVEEGLTDLVNKYDIEV